MLEFETAVELKPVSASSADNQVKDSPVDSPEDPAFKRILVPTDFSESAEQALNYAVRLSKPYRAEIVVLHVFHLREYLALLIRTGADRFGDGE